MPRIKQIAYEAFYRVGLHHCFGRHSNAAILMLHSVVDAHPQRDFHPNRQFLMTKDVFVGLLDALTDFGYSFVTLDEVFERLRAGDIKSKCVALTFDDGYRDNYSVVWPICRDRQIPITVYVTTGMIDRVHHAWWYGLEEWIATRERIEFELQGRHEVLSVATLQEKEAAYEKIARILQRARPSERYAFYRSVQANDAIDITSMSDALTLTWDELRRFAREPFVTIGAHSVSHAALSRLSAAEMREELAGSRALLEHHIGLPVWHFAYPYGDPSTVGPREYAAARKLGFVTATTTRHSLLSTIDRQTPHRLPRIPTDPFETRATLAVKLSGLPGKLKRVSDSLRKRNEASPQS